MPQPNKGKYVYDEHIYRLYDGGMENARAIAREVGCNHSTVCRALERGDKPRPIDRTRTENATKARQVDLKGKRQLLKEKLYDRALFNLTRLESGQYQFTVPVGFDIVTKVLDHVPAQDEKALSAAINQGVTAIGRLEQVDATASPTAAISMVQQLGSGLKALADQVEADADDANQAD